MEGRNEAGIPLRHDGALLRAVNDPSRLLPALQASKGFGCTAWI